MTLPVGVRGNWSTSRTSRGHLYPAKCSLRCLFTDSTHATSFSTGRMGSTTAATPLTEIRVLVSDDRSVTDVGVGDERVLDLDRVDVLTAAEDHEGGPVGEVHVAPFVQVTEIPDGAPTLRGATPVTPGLGPRRRGIRSPGIEKLRQDEVEATALRADDHVL